MDLEQVKKDIFKYSPLKEGYLQAKKKGYCKCTNPLYLFAGPNNAYCARCNKVIKEL